MTHRYLAGLLLLWLWGCATTRAPAREQLAFIEDDLEAALRVARETGRPVFVDAWAPWCQSCRAMRATVLTDPRVTAHGPRFVWLAINTDAPANADFLRRFPVDTWPTLLVLTPEGPDVLARSLGALSAPQLVAFLQSAERDLLARRAPPSAGKGASDALRRADALALAKTHAEAAAAYQRVLDQLAPDDARRAGVVVSTLKSQLSTGASEDCMRLVARELPALARVEDRARLLYVGLGCALDLDTPEALELRARLMEATRQALEAPADALAPVLRSALYDAGCEVHQSADDAAGLHALATRWWRFLEEDAREATSAEARAALDAHRLMASVHLEQPGRAIPFLQRSERELPQDYAPAARLATLYLMTGRLDEALQASQRALSLVKDAGRGMVLSGHARILHARGERAQAEQLLTRALRELEQAPSAPNTPQQRRLLTLTLEQLRAQAQ